MVERYPNFKEEIDGPLSSCEISSLLDKNLLRGHLHHVLWRWHVDLLSQKKIKNKKSRKTKKHTKTTCVTTRTQPCAQNVDTVVGLILHTIRRAPCNHFTRQYFVASYSSCTQSHLWTLKRQTMWLAIASRWDALASRSNAWNCPWCWSPCSRAREVFGHIE